MDPDAGTWKVNRIHAENVPSRADLPAGHCSVDGPRPRAPGARPISYGKRPSKRFFSAFNIPHSPPLRNVM